MADNTNSCSTNNFSFAGRNVLITGGGGGLGLDIAKHFLVAGATVYVIDKQKPLLDKLTDQVPPEVKDKSRLIGIHLDLTDWSATQKAFQDKLPALHHLVNNAGIFARNKLLDVSENELDQVLGVNLKATFLVSQQFAKNVAKHGTKGATIVNISSVTSRVVQPGAVAYACCQGAISMLTKSMAIELGQSLGIRVNSVMPTGMDTPLFRGATFQEWAKDNSEALRGRAIIKRQLKTTETAGLVMYLSNEASGMITGTEIPIDGGASAT